MIRQGAIARLAGLGLLPAFLAVALLGVAYLATAQDSHPPTSLPPALGQEGQAPAVIDTAVAVLEFSTSNGIPAAVHVSADTVLFGETIQVVVDIPGSGEQEPEMKVTEGDQWLVAESAEKPGFRDRMLGSGSSPGVPIENLPAFDGHRVTASFRVYRNQPFRFQVGDHLGPVIEVKPRISGTDETAAIRAPRSVGMSPLVILGLLAALVVILLAVWVFWVRGPGREQLADREIPSPAWLAAAVELRDLFWEGSLGRGETRPYLDGLAGIARRFVAGRYRISAQDMTGREIISACGGLGHSITNPGAFARMIDELDHRRYDPAASTPAWCREQTVKLFEKVGLVRVIPRYTEVPAEEVFEAEEAWKVLAREFAGATGRGRITDTTPGKKEA